MPATPTVYNFCWLSHVPGPDNDVAAALSNENRLALQPEIGVVILYPSLTTPEILGPDDEVELILVAKDDAEVETRIHTQLKISAPFDYSKKCSKRGIFSNANGNKIDVPVISSLGTLDPNTKLETKSKRFAGYVESHACEVYKNAGYKNVYRVSMSNEVLAAATDDSSLKAFPEPQDILIRDVVTKYTPIELMRDGWYCCFKDGGADLDFTACDKDRPIVAWHLVFHYTQGLEYANLAHVSDIHLAARQQVLAKTHARVIEYGEDEDNEDSFIGRKINLCSKDLVEILNGFDEADILLVGGDLVDFLRSCYLSDKVNKKVEGGNPKHVWDAVDMGDNYQVYYRDYVDMVAFYGLLVSYCQDNKKPAYLVSGNHDCYLEPFGISPRVLAKSGMFSIRANAGIPADHNLTFYEALLAFGESYNVLKHLKSSFKPSTFDWFYTVFTPFVDYSIELKNQLLVACGWGNDEKMIDPEEAFGIYGQGASHLPRAPEAISENQKQLITKAVEKSKKVILMTHFTFVSYDDSIPINKGNTELGDVYCDWLKNYNDRNMGTFEKWRDVIFQQYLGQRKIQIVLTGHSHRRALYLIQCVDYSGRNSVKTRHFDFSYYPKLLNGGPPCSGKIPRWDPKELEPAIVVSDSGGTIPRFNLGGEFAGWGSDQPSGTVVNFDSTGAISEIKAVRADSCKPRAVAALDFMDIEKGEDVISSFETGYLQFSEGDPRELSFRLTLHPELRSRGVFVESVTLYLVDPGNGSRELAMARHVVTDSSVSDPQDFRISDMAAFAKIMRSKKRSTFMAMTFGAAGVIVDDEEWEFARYKFGDPWCFEFYVDFELYPPPEGEYPVPPTSLKYMLVRDKYRAEYPDFDWRRKHFPGKYK